MFSYLQRSPALFGHGGSRFFAGGLWFRWSGVRPGSFGASALREKLQASTSDRQIASGCSRLAFVVVHHDLGCALLACIKRVLAIARHDSERQRDGLGL